MCRESESVPVRKERKEKTTVLPTGANKARISRFSVRRNETFSANTVVPWYILLMSLMSQNYCRSSCL